MWLLGRFPLLLGGLEYGDWNHKSRLLCMRKTTEVDVMNGLKILFRYHNWVYLSFLIQMRRLFPLPTGNMCMRLVGINVATSVGLVT